MPTLLSSEPDVRPEVSRREERMALAGLPLGEAAPPPRRRRGPSGAGKGPSRLGWKAWLLIDGLFLLVLAGAVVVWPPLSACRTHAEQVGFYAGDSIEKCTRRGVSTRLERADQRIKMFFRGSGR